jgi:hypothetical protein
MTNGWQDTMVGARMAVDRTFAGRVQSSELSRSQWGLVMTAVEFEVENADDPDAARMVADTSKLEHVVPEMQNVDDQMSQMRGGSTGGRGGMVDGIKNALGLGGGDDDGEELEATAAQLAQEYADELQAHLEDEGRWDEIRQAAAND